ncbi:MAG: hypothetical protein HKN77_10530 [Woeseiaceae bacterium]|nr:hypothetical protein [Woeseiaceae bacterium]
MNLDSFIQRNRLPDEFAESAENYFFPFAEWLQTQLAGKHGETYVLGVNGAQGTGKSTLAQLISEYLAREHGRKVVVLSIDDIYLTRKEREALGQSIHPLLKTRGVPGTHDVALGAAVIKRLRTLRQGNAVDVPRFDKSSDDRCAPVDWPTVAGPVDLVIFEGWCVGSQATTEAELQEPVNALEASQDSDGRWRRYVNDKLGNEYAELFQELDSLLFLKVPDFEAVQRWRLEQEQKLRQSAGKNATAVMSDEEVVEFIQYYERITRENLHVLPSIADAVIELDDNHQAISLNYPN